MLLLLFFPAFSSYLLFFPCLASLVNVPLFFFFFLALIFSVFFFFLLLFHRIFAFFNLPKKSSLFVYIISYLLIATSVSCLCSLVLPTQYELLVATHTGYIRSFSLRLSQIYTCISVLNVFYLYFSLCTAQKNTTTAERMPISRGRRRTYMRI
jgi:hypothetical protein